MGSPNGESRGALQDGLARRFGFDRDRGLSGAVVAKSKLNIFPKTLAEDERIAWLERVRGRLPSAGIVDEDIGGREMIGQEKG